MTDTKIKWKEHTWGDDGSMVMTTSLASATSRGLCTVLAPFSAKLLITALFLGTGQHKQNSSAAWEEM